jgi:translation initiation factor IF-2
VSQPKVYEFAKEIGMETIALMDKIREWDLPVKSHMAALSDDLIDEIRKRLNGGDSDEAGKSAKKTKKKTVAKKKRQKRQPRKSRRRSQRK